MIYEIRDYHYRPDLMTEYRAWATDIVAFLRAHIDVVGFWIDEGTHPAEISGSDPIDSPIGHANVTWIIRWASMEARQGRLGEVFSLPEGREVMARHPDRKGYRQVSARFMTAI